MTTTQAVKRGAIENAYRATESTAMLAITGFKDRGRQRARLEFLRDELNTLQADYVARHTAAVAAFDDAVNGDAAAVDVIAARANLDDVERTAHAYTATAERVRDQLRGFSNLDIRDVYEDEDVAPALEYLDERLQALMADVLDLDEVLGSTRTAEGALEAGGAIADAWLALGEAVTAYERIRQAQERILFHLVPDDGRKQPSGVFRRHAYVRDSFGYEPAYLDERRPSTVNRHRHAGAEPWFEWRDYPVTPPWHRERTQIWPSDNQHGHLRELARSGQAWVPTIAELEHFAGLAVQMLEPNLTFALAAFDEYYAGRDLDPLGTAPDTKTIREAIR